MLILHAVWQLRAGAFLWAEGAQAAARAASAPFPTDAAHPYAAGPLRLREALERAGGELPGRAVKDRVQGVWLPSDRQQPLASPTLRSRVRLAPGDPRGDFPLRQFQVPGLFLELRVAQRLVAAMGDGTPGIVPGGSMTLLQALDEFAADVIRRGRVLPELDLGADEPRVRWCPSLRLPEDRARLVALADAIPGGMLDVAYLVEAGARRIEAERARRVRAEGVLADLTAVRAEASLGKLPVDAAVWGEVSRARLQALGEWRRAFDAPASEAYRLDLEVREPVGAEESFQLHADLVPRAEPQLRVPLCEVLQAGGADAKLAAHPPGYLEQAQVWIDTLSEAFPRATDLEEGPIDLSLGEAQVLLTDHLGAWERAGFRCLAPAFWRERGAAVRARVARSGGSLPRPATQGSTRAAPASGSQVGLDQIVKFDWRLALDDEELTDDEVTAAAEADGGLVKLRGQWRRLDSNEVAAAKKVAAKDEFEAPAAPLVSWLRWSVGLDASPVGLEVESGEGGVLGLLAENSGEASEAMAEIEGFHGVLRPYQERGVAWLEGLARLGLGACLADDMGLGKTVQMLALLARERTGGGNPGPTLLVCPTSLLGNWAREARRFVPTLRVMTHHGPGRAKGEDFQEARGGADLVLTNYQVAARDRNDLMARAWHRVVLDEAQHVKNPDTAQAKAVRALGSTQRIALTGTPVENRLMELWSLMQFLNPGLLGKRRAFQDGFVKPIEKKGDEAAAAALRGLVAPFLLRRKKTDPELVPELPDKLERTLTCALTPEQAALYQATVDGLLENVEGAEGMARRGVVLAALTRLKQVCNHPAQALKEGTEADLEGRSGKLDAFEETVAQVLDAEERLLVFTQYREMGEMLRARLKSRFTLDAPFLHGGVSRVGRDKMVEEFQAGRGGPVLVLSLKAGGTGLNLTAANHVVHYDRWWNPAVEDQASDRAFRIGQRRDVVVHRLVCQGTLEERIHDMLEEKRALAEQVVGTGESWLTELATDELRALVQLGGVA